MSENAPAGDALTDSQLAEIESEVRLHPKIGWYGHKEVVSALVREVRVTRQALRRICDAIVGPMLVADLEPWMDLLKAVDDATSVLPSTQEPRPSDAKAANVEVL